MSEILTENKDLKIKLELLKIFKEQKQLVNIQDFFKVLLMVKDQEDQILEQLNNIEETLCAKILN